MRITLFNVRSKATMRMDLDPGEGIRDIADTVSEAWGEGNRMVLRDGYSILSPENGIEGIREGDIIEVLPDPFGRAPNP